MIPMQGRHARATSNAAKRENGDPHVTRLRGEKKKGPWRTSIETRKIKQGPGTLGDGAAEDGIWKVKRKISCGR